MPQTPKHPQQKVANERDGAESMEAITVDIWRAPLDMVKLRVVLRAV